VNYVSSFKIVNSMSRTGLRNCVQEGFIDYGKRIADGLELGVIPEPFVDVEA
jgi:hypothetical protein